VSGKDLEWAMMGTWNLGWNKVLTQKVGWQEGVQIIKADMEKTFEGPLSLMAEGIRLY
jgi:hypothetical protein